MAGYLSTASESLMELANQAAAVASSTCATVAESLQVSCQAVAGTILSYKYQERQLTDSPDFPDTLQPVWLLGRPYSARHDLQELRDLVQSRFWFTYRKDFPPIGDSGVTSDQGWGCMLRCGQMVLGSALIDTKLGRDWRWCRKAHEDLVYRDILAKFQDNKTAPFSIHQISLMGESVENKPVGTWFGPNTVAQVLRKLLKFDPANELVIHVAMDNTLILSEVKEVCTSYTQGEDGAERRTWRPLLLFVSLRLGLAEINPVYFSGLKTCFSLPQTQGVIGGRPNHALYLLGCVEDEVIFLDPHVTQPTVNVTQWSELLARTRTAEQGEEQREAQVEEAEEGMEEGVENEEKMEMRESGDTSQLHQSEISRNCGAEKALDAAAMTMDAAAMTMDAAAMTMDAAAMTIVEKVAEEEGLDEKSSPLPSTVDSDERIVSSSVHEDAGEEAEGELLYREREEVEAMDRTFHSPRPGRLNIRELDPSLSLCFLCHTEEDFDNLCRELQEKMICREKTPLFEMLPERPPHMFPPSNCDIHVQPDERTGLDYEQIERKYDSEEEFEIL